MATSHGTTALTASAIKQMGSWVSSETRELVALGHTHQWNVVVLGQAPLPSAPLRLGDWLVVPASQDSSHIPTRALERVQAIYGAGLRPRGFVLVHEAPALLAAPAHERTQKPPLKMPTVPPELTAFLPVAARALGIAVLSLAAISAAAVMAVAAALVVGVAMVDPILIAVTEDGYWIEIDRWTA